MTNFLYWFLGKPRKAGDGSLIYHRDPLFVLFVTIPFWVGVISAFLGPVGLFASLWLWLFALMMFLCCFPLIPPPDMAVRQIFGQRRYFMECRVFVLGWIHTKTVVFPGDKDVIQTADHKPEPGESVDLLHPEKSIAITSMVKQKTTKVIRTETVPATPTTPAQYKDDTVEVEGFDEQLFVIQIFYRLGLLTSPQLVVDAFYENYAPHSLERLRGSWGERVRECKKRGNAGVVSQIIDVVAGRCDEVLSTRELSDMMLQRQDVNDALTKHLKHEPATPKDAPGQPSEDPISPLEELGVELIRAAIPDIKDVHPNGWISSNSSATRREQEEAANVRKTHAKQTADLEQISAFQATEIARANTDRQVAQQRVMTLQQQVLAAEQEAKITLQPLLARIAIAAEKGDAMAVNSILSKLDQLSGADLAAMMQAIGQAIGRPPETLVNLGGNLLDAQPITAIIAALKQIFPQLFNGSKAGTPATPPVTPSP